MRTNEEINELHDKIVEYITINQPCSFRFTGSKYSSDESIKEAEEIRKFLGYKNTGYIAAAIRCLLKSGEITRKWSKTASPMYLYSIPYEELNIDTTNKGDVKNMGAWKEQAIEQMEADYIYEQEQKEEDLNEDLIKSILDEHTKNFQVIRKTEIKQEEKFREDAINKAIIETENKYSKMFNQLNQETFTQKDKIEKLEKAYQTLKEESAKSLTHSEDIYKSNLEKANSEIVRLNAVIEKLKNNLSRLSSYRDLSLKKFGAEYSKTSLASMIINEDVSELCYKQDGNGKSLHIKK